MGASIGLGRVKTGPRVLFRGEWGDCSTGTVDAPCFTLTATGVEFRSMNDADPRAGSDNGRTYATNLAVDGSRMEKVYVEVPARPLPGGIEVTA